MRDSCGTKNSSILRGKMMLRVSFPVPPGLTGFDTRRVPKYFSPLLNIFLQHPQVRGFHSNSAAAIAFPNYPIKEDWETAAPPCELGGYFKGAMEKRRAKEFAF